jgi:hypothetical protein
VCLKIYFGKCEQNSFTLENVCKTQFYLGKCVQYTVLPWKMCAIHSFILENVSKTQHYLGKCVLNAVFFLHKGCLSHIQCNLVCVFSLLFRLK